MILGMNAMSNEKNDFMEYKEKIIQFEYKIGIKLIGFDYDLQENFGMQI